MSCLGWQATTSTRCSNGASSLIPCKFILNSILIPIPTPDKNHAYLILDTGAPAVFITKAVAKKSGVDLDAKGWGTFDKFEVEGGLKVEKVKTRVEDLIQIEGMNSMGLAGVELHGVIGYNVLQGERFLFSR